jgi:aryl-alcohol dehydrogenase-like predicted oxidoreductase
MYHEEEREMIPYCKSTGVGLIPWGDQSDVFLLAISQSPLGRDILSRPMNSEKTARERSTRPSRVIIASKKMSKTNAIVGRAEEISKRHGISMVIVATA